jgi:hypothetical protein
MYLWKISQDENTGYDTFNAAIVAAETEFDARRVHPSGCSLTDGDPSVWVESPSFVRCELIGTAVSNIPEVILASFRAG